MDSLEIPDQLAVISVQGDHAICEEVVTRTVHAIEVIARRSSGDEHHASSGIDYRASPSIRTPQQRFTCVTRPSLRSGLAIGGNGVKRPAQLAGVHIEGPLIPGGGWCGFGDSRSDDQHVLVDNGW